MTWILDVALVVVALTVLPAVYRIFTGPRDADRAVAADVVFFAVVAVVALLGLRLGAGIALDVILVASVVGFLATMSLARLVTRGATMTGVLEVVGTGLIVLGALAFVATGVGVLRLPDLYCRISSVTTASGFGVGLVVFGVVLHAPSVTNILQGILAVLLNLTTAAVGGHALGRAGYLSGAPLSRRTGYDDLGADRGAEKRP